VRSRITKHGPVVATIEIHADETAYLKLTTQIKNMNVRDLLRDALPTGHMARKV